MEFRKGINYAFREQTKQMEEWRASDFCSEHSVRWGSARVRLAGQVRDDLIKQERPGSDLSEALESTNRIVVRRIDLLSRFHRVKL